MKCKGIKRKEFTSDKTILFDPPKRMLVWNEDEDMAYIARVVAYMPNRSCLPVITKEDTWDYCAEIPEEPKPRRATNRELAKWLAQGNGEITSDHPSVTLAINNKPYEKKHSEDPVDNDIIIRKWDDTEWHEPTVDYMFGEDAK